MPDDMGTELEAAVRRNVWHFRMMIDIMGEEEFSQVTIDIGYDYD